MNNRILGAALATSLLAGVTGAQAQVATQPATPPQSSTTTTTTTTTTVTPDQQSKIRQVVTREKRTSVTAPTGFTVAVGSTLPETVQVYALPSDVGVTNYRYTVVNDRTVLIDPTTRRVIQVLD